MGVLRQLQADGRGPVVRIRPNRHIQNRGRKDDSGHRYPLAFSIPRHGLLSEAHQEREDRRRWLHPTRHSRRLGGCRGCPRRKRDKTRGHLAGLAFSIPDCRRTQRGWRQHHERKHTRLPRPCNHDARRQKGGHLRARRSRVHPVRLLRAKEAGHLLLRLAFSIPCNPRTKQHNGLSGRQGAMGVSRWLRYCREDG